MQKFKVYFWKCLPKRYFKEIKERYRDRKNDYMNIYICDNREEMYKLTDKLEGRAIERNYGARTTCYDRKYHDVETGEVIKTSPLCGEIVFDKEHFYTNTIAHESTHAVIGYYNRKLKDCQDIFTRTNELGDILDEEVPSEEDLEELFAYMVGNISDQIVCGYKK